MTSSLHTFSGREWSQATSELWQFIRLLQEYHVRSYLEIGARDGDSFHAVMSALPEGARGVAVDMPGSLWGRKKSRSNLLAAASDLEDRGYTVSVLLGDSHAARTQKEVRARGPYDAIFIDGDHTYDGVLKDWQAYGSMARIVAFHDIAGEGQSTRRGAFPVEVPKLWAEIKAQARLSGHVDTLEFIEPGSHMGIGVVIR